MIAKIRKRVAECFRIAEKHYGRKFPRPKIKFDLTGVSISDEPSGQKLLRFNVKLAVPNEEEVLREWVPHSVAHALNRCLNGTAVKTHGREWKKIMIEVFRVKPRINHKFDVSKVKRRTKEYEYTCGCPGKVHLMGAIKHKKLQREKRVSQCQVCGAKLEFKGRDQPKVKGLRELEID